MKNKRTKKFIKLGILLFGIAIFVIACEKDNFAEEKTLETLTEELPISIKSISISEAGETFNSLKNKYQFDNHFGLQQTGNTQHRAAEEQENSGIIIYADKVKEIIQGDYISYTMLIKSLDLDPDTFYNITIEEKNGIEGMFVTQYTKANESSISKISTKRINDLQEIIGKEDFGNEDEETIGGGSGGSGNSVYPTDCEGTVVPTTIAIENNCGCGHNILQWQLGICSGSSCGDPFLPYYEFVTTYECVGSDNDNPPDNTDPTTGNPDTSGPGGGSTVGSDGNNTNNPSLTSPVDPEEGAASDDDPCKRMKELEDEINLSNLSDYYTALNFYANNDNVIAEVGFALFDKQSNGNYNSADLIGTEEKPYIATSFFADLPPMSVYMHTHFKGLLSIFSVPDLKLIHKLIDKDRTIGTDFVSILVTNAGTRYAIKVINIAKFNAVANLNLYDDEKFEEFVNDHFSDVKEKNDNTTNELNFLKGLKSADMGLSLFEANSDYTEWKELTLDPNDDDNIIPIDCN